MNNAADDRNVTTTAPLLRVHDLCVSFTTDEGTTTALDGISFDLHVGEILGIAGESGSGKSVTALAILNLLPRPAAHIVSGQVFFDDHNIFDLTAQEKQHIRGKRIAMIFQEPVSALNPVHTIGQQLAEVYRTHFSSMSAQDITKACIEMLTQVGIAEPARRLNDYPHQLSGGQCQRVMIAMALACKPDILIADEPTTALDVTTQQQILQLLRELQPVFGMSVIFITHDLSVIAHLCDRVIIMEHGVIREMNTVQRIFNQAQDAYTQELLGAMLTMDSARQPSSQLATPEILLQLRNVSKSFPLTGGIFGRTRGHFQALHDISFTINRGETLGLVGESGCGKSTLGRAILQLDRPSTGDIIFDGTSFDTLNRHDMHLIRRRMQVIFQNANDSLNPRHTVGTILEEPFIIHGIGTSIERARWCLELLDKVELESASIHRYPHQLSGGQRQRIGIARALALKPEFIVCDEPVSALDVTTQHHILELLLHLKQEFDLTLLFISHDLAVVKHIADRVAVMYQGGIVEIADTVTLFDSPQHPYTRSLLAAIPRLSLKTL